MDLLREICHTGLKIKSQKSHCIAINTVLLNIIFLEN